MSNATSEILLDLRWYNCIRKKRLIFILLKKFSSKKSSALRIKTCFSIPCSTKLNLVVRFCFTTSYHLFQFINNRVKSFWVNHYLISKFEGFQITIESDDLNYLIMNWYNGDNNFRNTWLNSSPFSIFRITLGILLRKLICPERFFASETSVSLNTRSMVFPTWSHSGREADSISKAEKTCPFTSASTSKMAPDCWMVVIVPGNLFIVKVQ